MTLIRQVVRDLVKDAGWVIFYGFLTAMSIMAFVLVGLSYQHVASQKRPCKAASCRRRKGVPQIRKGMRCKMEEKRINSGYEIIESHTIGSNELVIGGRGRAVFGTCLATGEQARWERYDVLGEIKPECMPDWAKEALAKIKAQEKEKKQKSREER